MFWRFNYSTSQLQTLLEKEDVTLQEVLDEEDVLQECKSNNEKLIEFLTRKENLNQLVDNVILVPSEELDEKIRFKNASISCEILTSDIAPMNDALVADINILDKLYSFLQNNSNLNPLMASYFTKVYGCLISRKTESFLNYIQNKEDFLSLFLKHANTSAVIDIILRLLTTIDSNDLRLKSINWLKDVKLIKNLINLLHFKYENQIQSNASQLICDIIRISREQILNYRDNNIDYSNNLFDNKAEDDVKIEKPSEVSDLVKETLLEDIESFENIESLLDIIFESVDKENCSLNYGIDILLTLLETKSSPNIESIETQNLELEFARKEKDKTDLVSNGIQKVLKCCTNKLIKFHDILLNTKPKIENLYNLNNEKIELLGAVRLNVIKLITKLINLNSNDFNAEMIKLGTMNVILGLFLACKRNNFLHSQVVNIITIIFSVDEKSIKSKNIAINENENENENANVKIQEISTELLEHILKDCNLIKRLLDAWNIYFSIKEENKAKKLSQDIGYIGHLTVLSNLIQNNLKKDGIFLQLIQKFVNENEITEWKQLMDIKISEINQINSKDLVKNPYLSSPTDLNIDNEFIDLPNEEKLNKKFLDLQKEMKINCVEEFSLSENQIINYNTKQEIISKSKNISFHLESNDDSAQLFEQICSQRDNMNLALEKSLKDNDEDMWVTQEIKFSDDYDNCFGKSVLDSTNQSKSFSHNLITTKKVHENAEKRNKSSNQNDKSSSSSSHSSSDESASDDDDNLRKNNDDFKKGKTNKLRHHESYHHYKETKTQMDTINQDSLVDMFSKSSSSNTNVKNENSTVKSDESNQNWADFDSVFKSEMSSVNENQHLIQDKNPWDMQVETNDTLKSENDGWANFDS